MQWLVDHFYLLILAAGIAHCFALVGLWAAGKKQLREISFYLFNLVKGFSSSIDHHPGLTVHEQIDSFIADISEVLHNRERAADRSKLYHRLIIKDESKRDLRGTKLETFYNVARTSIEAYPLLGILGTIFAIALGLNSPRPMPSIAGAGQSIVATTQGAASASPEEEFPAATSSAIIRNFANSIWSTASGIGFAIVLMIVNSCIEPGFDRLEGHRKSVRDVIGAAKIQLGMGVLDGQPRSETAEAAAAPAAARVATGGAKT